MSEALPDLAARVLDRLAGREPADEILRDLCLSFERELPASVVGVTMLDRSAQVFEHAVFPSLADDYAAALEERYVRRRSLGGLFDEVRRFYRLGCGGKLGHIARKAA